MNFRIAEFSVVSCLVATAIACGGGQQQPSQERPVSVDAVAETGTTAIVDHAVESLSGESVDLASFRGKPMLIVNTASKCGYTPQYESLQKLYEKYGEGDLVG